MHVVCQQKRPENWTDGHIPLNLSQENVITRCYGIQPDVPAALQCFYMSKFGSVFSKLGLFSHISVFFLDISKMFFF